MVGVSSSQPRWHARPKRWGWARPWPSASSRSGVQASAASASSTAGISRNDSSPAPTEMRSAGAPARTRPPADPPNLRGPQTRGSGSCGPGPRTRRRCRRSGRARPTDRVLRPRRTGAPGEHALRPVQIPGARMDRRQRHGRRSRGELDDPHRLRPQTERLDLGHAEPARVGGIAARPQRGARRPRRRNRSGCSDSGPGRRGSRSIRSTVATMSPSVDLQTDFLHDLPARRLRHRLAELLRAARQAPMARAAAACRAGPGEPGRRARPRRPRRRSDGRDTRGSWRAAATRTASARRCSCTADRGRSRRW